MLRGQDLHLRPQGYEPCELLLLHPAAANVLRMLVAGNFMLFERETREDYFGERHGSEYKDGEKELLPVECYEKHAEGVGDEDERKEP